MIREMGEGLSFGYAWSSVYATAMPCRLEKTRAEVVSCDGVCGAQSPLRRVLSVCLAWNLCWRKLKIPR